MYGSQCVHLRVYTQMVYLVLNKRQENKSASDGGILNYTLHHMKKNRQDKYKKKPTLISVFIIQFLKLIKVFYIFFSRAVALHGSFVASHTCTIYLYWTVDSGQIFYFGSYKNICSKSINFNSLKAQIQKQKSQFQLHKLSFSSNNNLLQ